MEKEIKEIIEKNMPAQVGDVLRKRLEQAEEDSEKVIELSEELQSKNNQIQLLDKKIQEYMKFDERNSKLEARELSVKEGEINLKISMLEYQLQSEKDKTIFSQNLAMGLVRNTNYKESVFDNEYKTGYYDSNNVWHDGTNTTKSYTKDITKD